jgi:uncharacterized protein YecE (DUF72 family)
MIRIGTSGWNYPHWRGTFYPSDLPAARWLEHYASAFDTVEVNATFYRLPTVTTVRHWVEQTPVDFVFSVKASRYLTHVKRLRDLEPGLERFLDRLEPLLRSSKLGPILWQLPASFRRDDERLVKAIERLPPIRHCFEFRHESWFTGDVYALLGEHRAALVVGDHPERRFQTRKLTTDFAYVRFHVGDLPDGNYSNASLARWRGRLRRWGEQADVYAYFNNDGSMAVSPENFERYVRFARSA